MGNLNYEKLAANLNVKLDDELSKRFQIIFKGKDIASMPEHEVWQHLLSKLHIMRGAKCLEGRNVEVCQTIQEKASEYKYKAPEKQEKPDISNFTVLPTLQDDSILMQDEKDVTEPELLVQPQATPPKKTITERMLSFGIGALNFGIAYLGASMACDAIGFATGIPAENFKGVDAAVIFLKDFAKEMFTAGATAAALKQKTEEQRKEIQSLTIVNQQQEKLLDMPKPLPTSNLVKLTIPLPRTAELVEFTPGQQSRDPVGLGTVRNPDYNRGVANYTYGELSQAARTGYTAAMQKFNTTQFKNFAGGVFSKNKELFGQYFVLENDGKPKLNKDDNLIPKGDFKFDELYAELLKQAPIIDHPLDMAAIFARLPGTGDVCKKLSSGELKLTESQIEIGNGLVNDLCAAYKIEPGVPLELGKANQQTEKMTKQRNSIAAIAVLAIAAVVSGASVIVNKVSREKGKAAALKALNE